MLIRFPDDGATTHVYVSTALVQRVYANGPVNPPTDPTWLLRVDLATAGTVTLRSGLTQSEAESAADEIAVALGVDWEPV